ncbi:hypothetical protein [Streptomyces sp. NPDC094032]|uniref:mevalonate kinase family protein n=1 Tax=Streptomyces sp. NPDC094032 TaxID=3155308 RepID=UPI003331ECD5
MSAVLARVPGKVVLSGEHAAVLGRPALAAAVGRHCTASVRARPDARVGLLLPDVGVRRHTDWPSIRRYTAAARDRWTAHTAAARPGGFTAVRGDDPAHLVLAALGETLPHLPRPPGGLTLTVRSALPPGAGFGSSAAVAVATAAALLAHAIGSADARTVAGAAGRAEELQHGSPSGVDTATVLRGGLLWLAPDGRGAARADPLTVAGDVQDLFELHHTGPAAEPTGQVVAAVRGRLTPGLLDRAERATAGLREALTAPVPDRAGVIASVRESARFLAALGVVPPSVAAIVRAVEAAGGAAKVCGAGSLRGPGAGALLVVRPPGEPVPIPGLSDTTRIGAPLGGPGLHWETTR